MSSYAALVLVRSLFLGAGFLMFSYAAIFEHWGWGFAAVVLLALLTGTPKAPSKPDRPLESL